MPKKRKPSETFDEFLGDAVESAMNGARLTQAELADLVGMPLSNLGRSIRGSRPLSVSEFERLVGAINAAEVEARMTITPRHSLVDAALAKFGGIEKLLTEYRPHDQMSDTTATVEPLKPVAPVDNVTYLGRVKAPIGAAADTHPRTPPKD